LASKSFWTNTSHYATIQADPVGEEAWALRIWEQLATTWYQQWNESMLYFKIQNKLHGKFNDDPTRPLEHIHAKVLGCCP
jgi:hypothetical protein